MCEIGRRIYNKGFAAANDGNISCRLSDDRVLCTPTRVSKGYLKPDDLCIVDLEGKQISGKRKRSSEVLLHLTIMKARAEIRSVVHCHPPTRPRSPWPTNRSRSASCPKSKFLGRGGDLTL